MIKEVGTNLIVLENLLELDSTYSLFKINYDHSMSDKDFPLILSMHFSDGRPEFEIIDD